MGTLDINPNIPGATHLPSNLPFLCYKDDRGYTAFSITGTITI